MDGCHAFPRVSTRRLRALLGSLHSLRSYSKIINLMRFTVLYVSKVWLSSEPSGARAILRLSDFRIPKRHLMFSGCDGNHIQDLVRGKFPMALNTFSVTLAYRMNIYEYMGTRKSNHPQRLRSTSARFCCLNPMPIVTAHCSLILTLISLALLTPSSSSSPSRPLPCPPPPRILSCILLVSSSGLAHPRQAR